MAVPRETVFFIPSMIQKLLFHVQQEFAARIFSVSRGTNIFSRQIFVPRAIVGTPTFRSIVDAPTIRANVDASAFNVRTLRAFDSGFIWLLGAPHAELACGGFGNERPPSSP